MTDRRRSLISRIWREHLRRYRSRLGLALLFMVGLSAAELGFVEATRWIFAGLDPGQAAGTFGRATAGTVMVYGPLLVTGFAIFQAGFFYAQAVTAQMVGISVLRDMQKRMYAAILRYDLSQLKGRQGTEGKVGGLVSRFTNDMSVLQVTLRRIPNAARDIVRLLGFVTYLAFLDHVLFLAVFLIYPLIGIPITVIGKKIRRTSRRVQGQVGDVTGLLSESLTGQETVKGYGLEAHERERVGAAFDERKRLQVKLVRLRSLNEPVITIIASLSVAFIIAVAAFRIDRGLMSGPDLVAFLVAMALLSQPARGLGTLNAVLQEGLAAAERVFSVVDEEPKITSAPNPVPLPLKGGAAPTVTFENVSFSYEETTPLLRSFNLEVPGGATVALVGPSGAGKSTVFGLLPRFYEAFEGRILIEGTPVRSLDLADLRGTMSIVSQTPVLFDLSVADNIRLGRLDATDAEVRGAAEAAAAHRFIEQLPGGYDAPVGEGGNALSGGERQRIALARAFLKDAPILLLDEATSALDAESERLIEDAMLRLRRGKTTLVIAHRLSTIRNADKIAVMQAGSLVEEGTHKELIARGGAYARLVALQDRQAEPV